MLRRFAELAVLFYVFCYRINTSEDTFSFRCIGQTYSVVFLKKDDKFQGINRVEEAIICFFSSNTKSFISFFFISVNCKP